MGVRAVGVGGAATRGPDPVGVDGPRYRGSDRGARHPPTRGQRTEPRPGPGGRDRATGVVASLAIGMLARLGYEPVALTRQLDADVYLRSIGAASSCLV